MALLALASAKGSPGVTTSALALALAWPRCAVVAECDPAGGDVLAGYFRGTVTMSRGILGMTRATGHDSVTEGLLALDTTGARAVIPGVTDPAHAAALAERGPQLAELLTRFGIGDEPADVLADCGRLDSAHAPTELLRHADAVVLVVRSLLRSVRSARSWTSTLRDAVAVGTPGPPKLVLLLVGERQPYGHNDIVLHLELPSVGVLAWDPATAAVLSDGAAPSRQFHRSPLMRTARGVAQRLNGVANQHPPAPVQRTEATERAEVSRA